jgi:hypothetical protein
MRQLETDLWLKPRRGDWFEFTVSSSSELLTLFLLEMPVLNAARKIRLKGASAVKNAVDFNQRRRSKEADVNRFRC